jgi:hypothetical protein
MNISYAAATHCSKKLVQLQDTDALAKAVTNSQEAAPKAKLYINI